VGKFVKRRVMYIYQVCGEKGFEKNCVLKKECNSVCADIRVGEGMCPENSDVSSCIFRESAGKCVLTKTCYCRRCVVERRIWEGMTWFRSVIRCELKELRRCGWVHCRKCVRRCVLNQRV
jgi:hypothetical protein